MLKINILFLTGIANGLLIQCYFYSLLAFCIHSVSDPQGSCARGTLPVAPVPSEPPGWSIREQMCFLASQGRLLLAPKSHLESCSHRSLTI